MNTFVLNVVIIYRMPAEARLKLLVDEGSFEQWSGNIQAQDPLEFVDTLPYPERIKRSQEKQEKPDAIVTGAANLSRRTYSYCHNGFLSLLEDQWVL